MHSKITAIAAPASAPSLEIHVPKATENIRYSFIDGKLTIQVGLDAQTPIPTGIDAGKAMLDIIATIKDPATELHVHVAGGVNPQLMSMYLGFPIGGAPIVPKEVHYYFHDAQTVGRFPSVCMNSNEGAVGIMHDRSTPPFFYPSERGVQSVKIHMSHQVYGQWTKYQLAPNIENWLLLFADKQEYPYVEEKLNQLKTYLGAGKLVVHIDCPFPEKATQRLEQDHQVEDALKKERLHANAEKLVRKPGSVFFNTSDQTTIVQWEPDTKTILIQDAGFPELELLMDGIFHHAGQVDQIEIFISHFHEDHCEHLADVIRWAADHKIPVKLRFADGCLAGATGWALSNLHTCPHPGLSVEVVQTGHLYTRNDHRLDWTVPQTKALTHFIYCEGQAIFNNGRVCIWMGDSNPNFPNFEKEEVKPQLEAYFRETIQKVSEKLDQIQQKTTEKCPVVVFFDMGHYPKITESEIHQMFQALNEQFPQLEIQPIAIAKKCAEGHTLGQVLAA